MPDDRKRYWVLLHEDSTLCEISDSLDFNIPLDGPPIIRGVNTGSPVVPATTVQLFEIELTAVSAIQAVDESRKLIEHLVWKGGLIA